MLYLYSYSSSIRILRELIVSKSVQDPCSFDDRELNLSPVISSGSELRWSLRCAGFSGGIISGNSEFPQFLILGLERSGKTTLLYRPAGPTWVCLGDQRKSKDTKGQKNVRIPRKSGKCGLVWMRSRTRFSWRLLLIFET